MNCCSIFPEVHLNLPCSSFPFVGFQPENGNWVYLSSFVICSIVVWICDDGNCIFNAGYGAVNTVCIFNLGYCNSTVLVSVYQTKLLSSNTIF
jgi:hypothetical protein